MDGKCMRCDMTPRDTCMLTLWSIDIEAVRVLCATSTVQCAVQRTGSISSTMYYEYVM